MTKNIMVQGTMSSAGKSLLVTGLCRLLRQEGLDVAPFKSQNMALNSFITREGLEMGRAQVVQAEAAGLEPSVLMDPILLKPCSDRKSQVIVLGEPVGDMDAQTYYQYRPRLKAVVEQAYGALARDRDVVVIEGAGSPAEINLARDDIVNMGLAELVDAPVVLVADIDRGGVFAQIYGTIMLLPPEQRARIRGVVINKFRGDVTLLRSGIDQIQALTGVPVIGVLPYLDVEIDEEDSLSRRAAGADRPLDVAAIQLPRISNATDLAPLARSGRTRLRYVRKGGELGRPDMIVLPGTKSTMYDLLWMRQNGLEALVKRAAAQGVPVLGICGGYQMLGRTLSDPDGSELGGTMQGMGLLPVDTVFRREKIRLQSAGTVCPLEGMYSSLSGAEIAGYQIHMGESTVEKGTQPFLQLADGELDGAVCGNVWGTYLHGLLDGPLLPALERLLLERKGLDPDELPAPLEAAAFRETQYDILADALREHLDLGALRDILDRR